MNSEEQTNAPENVTGIPAPASGDGDGATAVSWAVTAETSTMANTIKKRALQMLMLAISKENEL
jgi:hypothetical protein